MIPPINDILVMLSRGEITVDLAEKWITQHLHLQYVKGQINAIDN
jgi:hypothetical protein